GLGQAEPVDNGAEERQYHDVGDGEVATGEPGTIADVPFPDAALAQQLVHPIAEIGAALAAELHREEDVGRIELLVELGDQTKAGRHRLGLARNERRFRIAALEILDDRDALVDADVTIHQRRYLPARIDRQIRGLLVLALEEI